MKLKLLLYLLFFLPSIAFAQAVAYAVPNLTQCENHVFNLTQQTPIVLGNQGPFPGQFEVFYYTSLTGAQTGSAAGYISNSSNYVLVGDSQVIYIRVQNAIGNAWDVTSFTIEVHTYTAAPPLPDIAVCGEYTLPPLSAYELYFTGFEGSGDFIPAGTTIYSSQIIYIHRVGICISDSSFMITVAPTPNIYPEDVIVCNEYVLPQLPFGSSYYTAAGATGVYLAPGTVISQSQYIYVFSQFGNCIADEMFSVNIGIPVLSSQILGTSCDENGNGFGIFDLTSLNTQITMGFSGLTVHFYETQNDADSNIAPIVNDAAYANTTAYFQTVFVRVDGAGGCYAVTDVSLQVIPCGSISGVVRLDANQNGCDAADVLTSNVQVRCTAGAQTRYAYTNEQGEYSFNAILPGTYGVSILPTMLGNASPGLQNVTTSAGNAAVQNFCISGNSFADLSVHIIPLTGARPGFDDHMLIRVKNEGSFTASAGVLTFHFNSNKLMLVAANPAAGSVSGNAMMFNYGALTAGQFIDFVLIFNVATPPIADLGDLLYFDANLSSNDINNTNNSSSAVQVIVNALDPNDKLVEEAIYNLDTPLPYLHYTVRFQNIGNAAAVNVRVEDQLDDNLDFSTFRPIASSHSYHSEMDQQGKVVFRFDNINLPGNGQNEQQSHGWVTYEVSPKAGLTVEDAVYNTAQIYFDFNAPIATNTVVTNFVDLLSVTTNAAPVFSMIPNPAHEEVTIALAAQMEFTVILFDLQGKMIAEQAAIGATKLDVSAIQKGIYLVKIVTREATLSKKLMID